MDCITAVETARKGYKTLLMTTDPASHIGEVLSVRVGDDISKVDGVENLYAVKIDQKKDTEEYKNSIIKPIYGLFLLWCNGAMRNLHFVNVKNKNNFKKKTLTLY